MIQIPATEIIKGSWNEGAVFAQTELSRVAYGLLRGQIVLPGQGVVGRIPMRRLKSLADIGPDRRDIHDGFNPTHQETEYAAFWGHDTESVDALAQRPNRYLMALPRARRGRNLRDAHLLWSRAGRLLISERLRLTTAKLVAVVVSETVLSNTWWPIAAYADGIDVRVLNKLLALWLNSSPGVLSLIASRVDTEGAWVELKKPILEELPVIDPEKLTEGAREKLTDAYDKLCRLPIQPLTQLANDEVRSQIDTALADALGLTRDFSVLRRLLAAEPIISMELPA